MGRNHLTALRWRLLVPSVFVLNLGLAFTWKTPVDATTPFLNEIADGSGNDVGRYASLALDAQGDPRVAYYDFTTRDLIYARKSGGTWTIETVHSGSIDVGSYASLALDPQGNPHISYYSASIAALFYARKSGGAWTSEVATPNNMGEFSSLALDAQGNPHVSCFNATTADLAYVRKSGGVWIVEIADGSTDNVGSHTSIALNSLGYPSVAYYNSTTGALSFALKLRTGFWQIPETVDEPGNVGQYASLALDNQGSPHISYYDATAGDLKHARRLGFPGIWIVETADASPHDVGSYASIALDAQGNPHVGYYDKTTGDLLYASKLGGAWTIETADGSVNSVGHHLSLALDGFGIPHMSYFDSTTFDLKYTDAAVHAVAPSPGATWPVGSRQNVSWSGAGPADILLSLDGGQTFDSILESIVTNTVAVRVPHAPTRFARIRIRRESPFSTSDTDSFFTINATISLLKFDAVVNKEDRTVALSWTTEPGPEADVQYRVERAWAESEAFVPLHAGMLSGDTYVDASPGAASRYRLIAVNGLGEEYALGSPVVAQTPLGTEHLLALSPSVSRGGEIQIDYRAATDYLATDVSVFDTSGRRVRTLISSAISQGIHTVTWDGRDESGRSVGPGVYLVRLAWGGNTRETSRVSLIR